MLFGKFEERVAETANTHHGDTETRRKEEESEKEPENADTSFDTYQYGENISFDFGLNDPEEPELADKATAFPTDENEGEAAQSANGEAVEGFRAPGGAASIPEVLRHATGSHSCMQVSAPRRHQRTASRLVLQP